MQNVQSSAVETPQTLMGFGRFRLVFGLLMLAMCCLAVASLCIGPANIPFMDLLSGLFATDDQPYTIIAQEIRLPRVMLAVVVGATLGISGAALQGLLRNPLAEPALIGTSSSAALGAVLALYYGFYQAFPMALPLMAVAGAIASIFLLYALAGRDPEILTLILAGVALSSFAGAAISVAINLSPDPHSALEIVFWLMGSLTDRSMTHFWLCLPFTVLGWVMLLSCGKGLDALSLGEETAHSLGIRLPQLRFRVIVGTALAVGGGVAVAGSIGFVGLVVPHLLRPLLGHRPSLLLWCSGLGGAVLLLAADIGVRLIPSNPELKLGVLTSVVGAPFFLMLVLRTRRQRM